MSGWPGGGRAAGVTQVTGSVGAVVVVEDMIARVGTGRYVVTSHECVHQKRGITKRNKSEAKEIMAFW
jgi:hypothetical protein